MRILLNTAGIAGSVFTSGKTMNIPYAYADLRFNPSFDKQTDTLQDPFYVPVINKEGVVDVHKYLIKVGENLLMRTNPIKRSPKSCNALENAKLFEDVSKSKYNESMLSSMSNGVITINSEEEIVTCNKSGLKILELKI